MNNKKYIDKRMLKNENDARRSNYPHCHPGSGGEDMKG